MKPWPVALPERNTQPGAAQTRLLWKCRAQSRNAVTGPGLNFRIEQRINESTALADRCESHSRHWSDCVWQRITLRVWSRWSGSRDPGARPLIRWVTVCYFYCWTVDSTTCLNVFPTLEGRLRFNLCVWCLHRWYQTWRVVIDSRINVNLSSISVCLPTG